MRSLRSDALPPHHDNCFGCGPRNPAGLGLALRASGDEVIGDLTLDRRHEGSPGLAHGGVIAAALDDLFAGLVMLLRTPSVTASLTVEYRRPVPLGIPLELAGRCTGSEGRRLHLHGSLAAGGELLAEGTAVFVRVDPAHFEQAGVPLPAGWLGWGA